MRPNSFVIPNVNFAHFFPRFRLCLLPKGLAVAYLFDIFTCVVVDSGATATYVWVVVDGKVDESRTQTMSVGGWHVSQFLKQALTWKDNKDAAGVNKAFVFHVGLGKLLGTLRVYSYLPLL